MADLGESIRVYKECLEDDVASVRRELETPASSFSSFQNVINASKINFTWLIIGFSHFDVFF